MAEELQSKAEVQRFVENMFPPNVDERIRQLQGQSKVPFPFAANWSNFGGALEDASYSRFGRLVVLQGLVTKSGTPTTGDVIGVLPVAPAENLLFSVVTGGTISFGAVRVESGGSVVWLAGNTTETDFTSLSGITFVVEA